VSIASNAAIRTMNFQLTIDLEANLEHCPVMAAIQPGDLAIPHGELPWDPPCLPATPPETGPLIPSEIID
jgi:hypothetical protein